MSYRANDALAACLRRLLACAAAVTASPPAANRRPRWWGPARALRLAIEQNEPATERRRCERDLLKVLMVSLASEDCAAEKNDSRRCLPGVRDD